MRSRRAALPLLLLAVGGVAAPAMARKTIDGVRRAPFRFGAMAIGQARDVDYARAEGLGLVPPSPLDTYVNGILAKLLAQSPVQGVPARVYVRASGDWAAMTTADANIYVALGALLRLDDEDEVAALLAHEAAHVILGHANADIVQGVQQRALQLSAFALETRDLVAGATGGSRTAKAGGDAARVKQQSGALLVNTTLIAPAWSRDQERDADLLGIDLLVRAGYAPQAMGSLLRKQASFETERAADLQAQALDEQLSAFGIDVNKEVGEHTATIGGGAGGAAGAIGALASGAVGAALEWGSKKVAKAQASHPKTTDRIADAERYVAAEYTSAAPSGPQVEPWEAAKEQDGTVDVLENYIAAIEAKGKLSAGDVAGAGRLAKTSLTGPTRTHAYPNYVDAAVQIARGASPAALADYERALSGPEPAGAIYTAASALYLQAGQADRAVTILESGYARLHEPPSLTVPLIHTYRAVGRHADATRVAATCAARWPKMQTVCLEEANGK